MKYSTGIVKFRVSNTNTNGHGNQAWSLTVPKAVTEAIPHLKNRAFRCELTEDGILYRLLPEDFALSVDLPEWARPR